MKLNEKEKEALVEMRGLRSAVIRLLDNGVSKAEADVLICDLTPEALMAARLKLEGARALRAHVAALMKPADKQAAW